MSFPSVRPRYHRPRRPVDLDALLARCPYPGPCAPVAPEHDLWQLTSARPRLPVLHRHNHLGCIHVGGGYWHPNDQMGNVHPDPALYLAARWPHELDWAAAWQRLVVILLSCRASSAQHQRDTRRLLNNLDAPWQLTTADLGLLLPATGARQQRALRELGERWPEHTSDWPASVDGWLGVGPQVSERYQLTVWGERPDPAEGWASPLLALTDAMGLIPWVVSRGPAR